MDPKDLLCVAIGGALGACLRYFVVICYPNGEFPFSTLTVNLTGSFFLGIFMALSTNNYFDDRVRLLFVTGILGSFTTMSTYSLESIILWKNNRFMCFIYIFSTALLGPICALLGFEIINKD